MRGRQLRRLLVAYPHKMRKLPRRTFGIEDQAPRGVTADAEAEETLIRLLDSRRLVLLSGERLSGRSRRAFKALQRGFPGYRLLRPTFSPASVEPPLTELLSAGVLSLPGRYILWLGDVSGLIEAGFDPRIVERWLAPGLGRVAIGRITPSDLQRIEASSTAAATALGRAVVVRVFPHRGPDAPGSVEELYRALLREDPTGATAVRIVATMELLGVARRSEAVVDEVLQRLTGERLREPMLEGLCAEGLQAPLSRIERALTAHPAITTIVDEALSVKIDPQLIAALIKSTGAAGLIAIARALASRRHPIYAKRALDRARELAGRQAPGGRMSAAVSQASVQLLELAQGPSGVTLSNSGGLDYKEPMGWAQRKKLGGRPRKPDDVFDTSLPPEHESFSTRFYRLTVHRAAARSAVLISIDTLAVALASVAALWVRALAQHHAYSVFDEDLLKLLAPAAAVTVTAAIWLGLYRPDAARARPQLILATMTIMSIIVAAAFLIARADIGSVEALFVMFAVAFVADCVLRYAYDVKSRRWVLARHLQPRVLILGSPEESRACAASIRSPGRRPVQPVAYLSRHEPDEAPGTRTYATLEERVLALHIAEIVIADRAATLDKKAELVDRVQRLGLDVRFVANENEIILGAIGHVDDHGLVRVPAALITPEALELKRAMDYLLVTLTLPLWGSIIAGYAAYSKLRRPHQPVFVRASRVGLAGNGFQMLRLRTRRVHEDKTRGVLASGRVEELFERLGLDELPQVFNVLRGEMSLVGPRPLADADLAGLTRAQRRTLGARPGMTGRWQLEWDEGGNEFDIRAMNAEYLRRWRISHDLDLILRTPLVIARRRRYLGDTEIRSRLRISGQASWSPRMPAAT
jgi:lipopolysaccharide/colanic/teichoic acid biosynthesis glycosyltransferase